MKRHLTLAVALTGLLACASASQAQITIQIGQPAPPPQPVHEVHEVYEVHEDHEHGPPPHAKAWGRRAKDREHVTHVYHYYPDQHVYYDPGPSLWFYVDGGSWRAGVNLPAHIQPSRWVAVRSEREVPYEEYEEHVKKFPPGQAKKMGGGKGKGKKKKWEEDD